MGPSKGTVRVAPLHLVSGDVKTDCIGAQHFQNTIDFVLKCYLPESRINCIG